MGVGPKKTSKFKNSHVAADPFSRSRNCGAIFEEPNRASQPPPNEVTLLATQSVIASLAERIERAYRRRRPEWNGSCSSARVWDAAAEALLAVHGREQSMPLDPELYVASQPIESTYPDPWKDLTEPVAMERYRARVRSIVRRLRAELSREVKFAELQIGLGQPVAKVLCSKSRRLSPLGRFVVAHRAGRIQLAGRFLPGAMLQHESCPLYRQACQRLLPEGRYPVPIGARTTTLKPSKPGPRIQAQLN